MAIGANLGAKAAEKFSEVVKALQGKEPPGDGAPPVPRTPTDSRGGYKVPTRSGGTS